MFFDHMGYIIFKKTSYFNYIGRIAFPLFAFQSVQGYLHTKDFVKYIRNLTILAIISQIPFSLYIYKISSSGIFKLNVLFTLILGLIAIFIYDKCKNKIIGFLSILLIGIISILLKTDYNIYGISIIFIFYYFKDKRLLMNLSFIAVTLIKYIISIIQNFSSIQTYIIYFISTCSSLIFINLFNKKQGPKLKYLFYIFYPLHLLIIYLISIFIIK